MLFQVRLEYPSFLLILGCMLLLVYKSCNCAREVKEAPPQLDSSLLEGDRSCASASPAFSLSCGDGGAPFAVCYPTSFYLLTHFSFLEVLLYAWHCRQYHV